MMVTPETVVAVTADRARAERPIKRRPFANMAVESKREVFFNQSELARIADDLKAVERRIWDEADGDELDLLYARKACLERTLAGF